MVHPYKLKIWLPQLELELLPKMASNVTLHILENSILSYNLILGRDFLTNNNISFTYTPLGEDLKNRIQLFFEIATINVIESTSDYNKPFK